MEIRRQKLQKGEEKNLASAGPAVGPKPEYHNRHRKRLQGSPAAQLQILLLASPVRSMLTTYRPFARMGSGRARVLGILPVR